MNQPLPASLGNCLAYVVLRDYEKWIGTACPGCFSAFLAGAEMRAALTGVILPQWRIHGPLEIPEFYLPLVARTGHPTLSIKWAGALELYHFSLSEAMRELLGLVEDWVGRNGLETNVTSARQGPPLTLTGLLQSLAKRPGMYLGTYGTWGLRCYLAGMDEGGDWLGLPVLDGLRTIVDGIEVQSRHHYGSRFAVYRMEGVTRLLAWVGITPEA